MRELDYLRNRVNPQPMFQILQEAKALEQRGRRITHLEIGELSGFPNKAFSTALLHAASDPKSVNYGPSAGLPETRQALLDLNLVRYRVESVEQIVFAPANFLILAGLSSLARTECRVWIPDPGFPTYSLAADFLGLEKHPYSPLTVGCICKDLQAGDVVIVNNPSNPVGNCVPEAFIECMLKHGSTAVGVGQLWDDTYVDIVESQLSTDLSPELNGGGCDDMDDTVVIRSFSKEAAVPGLRAGYSLSSPRLAQAISNFVSLTISCSTSVVQIAVGKYLKDDCHNDFVAGVNSELSTRRHEISSNPYLSPKLLAVP